jgi:hypothetical protein
MKKSEKQIHFLNRLYSNIDHYKVLRTRIPIIIITLLIGICGFVVSSELPKNNFQLIGIISVLSLIGLIGIVTYKFVHDQYLDIASRIHYLWDKMDMMSESFIRKDKVPKLNPKQVAPRVFNMGYFAIIFMSLITVFLVIFK